MYIEKMENNKDTIKIIHILLWLFYKAYDVPCLYEQKKIIYNRMTIFSTAKKNIQRNAS